MSKLSRGQKAEKEISGILSSLEGYHLLINDYTYINTKTDMSHQIDHILLHPHGVFVIETKSYYGEIDINNNDTVWIKTIKGKKSVFPNPLIQNNSHRLLISKLLDKKVDVISLVVFSRNNAPMIDDNVINKDDLILFIESYPYQTLISNNVLDKAYKKLMDNISSISIDEHKANIKRLQKLTKEKQEDKRIAIEEGLCPICGRKISVSGYKYYCQKCGYKFSL